MAINQRKTAESDADLLWRWANDPVTRRNAFDESPIPFDTHVDWVTRRLASPSTRWWIFSDDGGPFGQVRFDVDGDTAIVDISVAPERRGHGRGREILTQAAQALRAERGRSVRVRAQVLTHNERSRAMFEACGFEVIDRETRAGKEALVLELRHAGPVLDRVDGCTVVDCEDCGFRHVLPLPSAEALAALYRDTYYGRDKPLFAQRQREDLDWWNLTFADRYDSFERFLPPERRTLLDVGSGPGFFLAHGQARGWSVAGLEPAAQAIAHARSLGVDVVEGFLDGTTAARVGRFDVVHASEVLEHVPDARCAVRRLAGLLNPDGLLCIVVPNDYSPFQHALRVDGYPPWWVVPRHHVNYFDRASLARLLSSEGFEILLTEATFPIDLFLLMGDNYVGNDTLGRQVHGRRKRFEQALADAGLTGLRREWYRSMAALGIGREIMMIGRRAAPSPTDPTRAR